MLVWCVKKRAAKELVLEGKPTLNEWFIDAAFAVGLAKRGNGNRIMAIRDGNSVLIAVSVASSSPSRMKPVSEMFEGQLIQKKPAVMVMNRGYDSNTIKNFFASRGIEPITPAGCNNHRAHIKMAEGFAATKRGGRLSVWTSGSRMTGGLLPAMNANPKTFLALSSFPA